MSNKTGGYIHKRADGRWNVHYKGRATTCKNETLAKAKLREWKQDTKVVKPNVEKLRIADAMIDWLNGAVKSQLKPSSFARKELSCQKQVIPAIGDIQVNSLTSKDVENMLIDLQNEGKSYSTIKKAYEAINGCMKYLVKHGTIQHNPINGVVLPNRDQRSDSNIRFYTDDDMSVIFKEAARKYSNESPVYRQGYAIMLLANTGMRISELLALTWGDIDFDKKTLRIDKNRVKVKSHNDDDSTKYIFIEQTGGKSSSSVRTIPLNEKSIAALNNIKSINGNFSHVISTKTGKPSDPKNIDRMFRNILTTCGITNKYGVHSLRHTFATSLIRKGVNIKIVSELLGHSDISTTLKVYTHFLENDYSDAVSKLD